MSVLAGSLPRVGAFDDATRVLLQACPHGLLRAVWGPELRRVRALEGQRATVLRLRDGLFEAWRAGRRLYPQVEFELTPRRRGPRRHARYWHQASLLGLEPFELAVVFLERGRWRGPLPDRFTTDGPDGRPVTVRFRALALWEVPVARAFSEATPRAPGLLPFVAFLAGATPEHVACAIDLLVRCQLPPVRRAEVATAAAIFGDRVFPSRRWRDILPPEVVMRSTLVDFWTAEAEARGKAEAARSMLLRVVRRKLSRLPRGLRAEVASLDDVDALQALTEEVAFAKSEAAARAALERGLARTR